MVILVRLCLLNGVNQRGLEFVPLEKNNFKNSINIGSAMLKLGGEIHNITKCKRI